MGNLPCKHLERELSKVYAHRSVHATPISYVDYVGETYIEEDKYQQLLEMLEKLAKHALPEIYAQVLALKFVFNWSDGEIADELSIPSRKTVFSMRQKALSLLKERNYK